jgi:hypothetical protein
MGVDTPSALVYKSYTYLFGHQFNLYNINYNTFAKIYINYNTKIIPSKNITSEVSNDIFLYYISHIKLIKLNAKDL